jgi:acetoin utilization protein AcuB
MTKSIPHISKYMTTTPHSIGLEQTIEKAEHLMREFKIRHLPVLSGGKVLGVVTDRDLKLYRSIAPDENAGDTTIEDVYQPEVFEVSPEATLDEVVMHMAEKKIGSAVVMDNKKLVGVFTNIDALRALAELLNTRLKK